MVGSVRGWSHPRAAGSLDALDPGRGLARFGRRHYLDGMGRAAASSRVVGRATAQRVLGLRAGEAGSRLREPAVLLLVQPAGVRLDPRAALVRHVPQARRADLGRLLARLRAELVLLRRERRLLLRLVLLEDAAPRRRCRRRGSRMGAPRPASARLAGTRARPPTALRELRADGGLLCRRLRQAR